MPVREAKGAAAPAAGGPRVSVVTGEEELLVERAVARLVAAAGDGGAAREVRAGALAPGELAVVTAPSLFDAVPVVVIRDAQDAGKEVAEELAALAADPPPDVVLVITHAGGAKGKALLGKLTGSGAQVAQYPKITRIGDRMTFIREEFRAEGRRIDDGGLRALIDALGSDLREIASACAQLAADTTGMIDQPTVARYYRGRAEAGGFAVADRAVEGRLAEALEHLRWALAVGVSPVLITSALADRQGAPAAARLDGRRDRPGAHRRRGGRRAGEGGGREPGLCPGGGRPHHRGLPRRPLRSPGKAMIVTFIAIFAHERHDHHETEAPGATACRGHQAPAGLGLAPGLGYPSSSELRPAVDVWGCRGQAIRPYPPTRTRT